MTINNNKTKNNFYLIQEFLKNHLKHILIKPKDTIHIKYTTEDVNGSIESFRTIHGIRWML